MDVAEKIGEARSHLASGHEGKAARILEVAVYETEDPELLKQIHELGLEGHDKAGLLHKTTWTDIIKESDGRLQRAARLVR